jgi:hypothetical protein
MGDAVWRTLLPPLSRRQIFKSVFSSSVAALIPSAPEASLPAGALSELDTRLSRGFTAYEYWSERQDRFYENGVDICEELCRASWDEIGRIKTRIAEITAANVQDLMIQAQLLAHYPLRGCPDEIALLTRFIEGIEKTWRARFDDIAGKEAALVQAGIKWDEAMDAVEDAGKRFEAIPIAHWALGHVDFIHDKELAAAVAVEQEKTGYRVARENLWSACKHLAQAEERVSHTVATSSGALLMQANTLERRLALFTTSPPNPNLGYMLLKGVERLGGRRTRDD